MENEEQREERHRQLDRAHRHIDIAVGSLHHLLQHRTDRNDLIVVFINRWTAEALFELACARAEHDLPVHP